MKVALTIAGSDSGGGAGIQADLKTFTANTCFGTSVITCLTAQNKEKVAALLSIPPSFVEAQLHAVFKGFKVVAVKIGMLFHAPIIEVVTNTLQQYKPPFIVLDPVMVAQTNDSLFDKQALKPLVESLFPLATLITPNLDEASVILGRKIYSIEDMPQAGFDLLKYGSQAVLIKGGHLESEKGVDCLVIPNHAPIWFKKETVTSSNTHGTGCTYSSAIAAWLANGFPLIKAVSQAKEYLHQTLLRRML